MVVAALLKRFKRLAYMCIFQCYLTAWLDQGRSLANMGLLGHYRFYCIILASPLSPPNPNSTLFTPIQITILRMFSCGLLESQFQNAALSANKHSLSSLVQILCSSSSLPYVLHCINCCIISLPFLSNQFSISILDSTYSWPFLILFLLIPGKHAALI